MHSIKNKIQSLATVYIKTVAGICIVFGIIHFNSNGMEQNFEQKYREAREYEEYREDVLLYQYLSKNSSIDADTINLKN